MQDISGDVIPLCDDSDLGFATSLYCGSIDSEQVDLNYGDNLYLGFTQPTDPIQLADFIVQATQGNVTEYYILCIL
ncbi:hypothetical protein HanPI659440_Chr02g0039191 [Helianthus annuus]|nr:hypothetical protein HanIR_Chr02g0058521 [Helianthus annuus]KAJ0804539.1 hypothetical protein HanPI659440_Chr02g0039191 [Helianthus annuus]